MPDYSFGAFAMSTPDQLIPVRALNQVSYCRRLYYLEYVEGLMPLNEHVLDGLFEHRRIADPRLAGRPRKERGRLQTRSLPLSSAALGLTGVVDVLEEKDGLTYPVETKRGPGPGTPPGWWDNDAIQLCGQALLLEEHLGQTIPTGVIYYAGSKTRVCVPLDQGLRDQTLRALEVIRELDARDVPPEPLSTELRHRCHGCSLAPVCQPEETLYLIQRHGVEAGEAPAAGIHRVVPQSDEGAVLYLQEQGSYVSKRSEHLIVKKDGTQLSCVPIAAIRQVVVFGNVQLSTQAITTLAVSQVPVVFLSVHGRFIAALEPAPTKNVMLRRDQYRVFADPERALALAQGVVKAKIANQRTLLMRTLRSRDDSAAEADPPERQAAEPAVHALAELLARVDASHDMTTLLGLEGQAASLYFGQFDRMLKSVPGRAFHFESRNRRPPRDPVNALLSLAYALLAKDCFSALCTVGFDPYQGFFHAGRHGRPSLALDLMEEFRPVIADSVVLTVINTAMVNIRDFIVWRDSCQLTDSGRESFFRAYEQRKATLVNHPLFGYKLSWGRMLEAQARLLAAYVRGDVPEYVGFTVR